MAQEIIIQVSCHDFFTRIVTEYHGFSLYHEFANCRIFSLSHGLSRMTPDVFLYPELSNYRIHDKIYKSVMLRGTPCEKKFDNYFPLVSGSKEQVS